MEINLLAIAVSAKITVFSADGLAILRTGRLIVVHGQIYLRVIPEGSIVAEPSVALEKLVSEMRASQPPIDVEHENLRSIAKRVLALNVVLMKIVLLRLWAVTKFFVWKNKMANKDYMKDLDALFSNDGKVPDRFKDLLDDVIPEEDSEEGIWRAWVNEITEIKDFREYAKAMTKFVKKKQAFPDTEDFLIRCLDHPSEKVYAACLKHIIDLFKRRGFQRCSPIENRMKTLRSLSEYPTTFEMLDQIEELINSKDKE